MEFLNLVNTDKYLRNLIDSGIEGTHYEKIDENTIKDLPRQTDSYDMATFSLGNTFLTYLKENEPADKWEQFEKFNAEATNAPLLGFHFDDSNVKTELAAVKNVKEEFMSALYTGSVDPEEFVPEAVEKMNKAGLDVVIEEAQKQLDEWLANQE
ncbi:DUF3502 domain-containing protein [Litoribacterium kuwaitense]|uniref:DUF3502 domain-containing protein n=1 Tax=Litoribacterium kuwaitense TaxID=1398745 RepID=UPI0028A64E9F|nr:DUF3502 domain-containing protein [Litoribacterium kuwaitense]